MSKRQRDELAEVSSYQRIVEKLHFLLTAEQKPERTLFRNLINKNLENIASVIKDSPSINLVSLLLDTNGETAQRLKIVTELVERCCDKDITIRTETQKCIIEVNSNISENPPLIALLQKNISCKLDISDMLFTALDDESKKKVRNDVEIFTKYHTFGPELKAFEKYINQPDNPSTEGGEANSSDEVESISLSVSNDELPLCNHMPKRQRDESTEVSSSQQIVDKLYSLLMAEQKPEQTLLHNLLNGNWENIDSVIKDSPTINLVALLLDTNREITQRLKIVTELVARCNSQGIGIRKETQKCITEVNSNISENPLLIDLLQDEILGCVKISKMLFDALEYEYKENTRKDVKNFKSTHTLSNMLEFFENQINPSDNHSIKRKKDFLDGNLESIDSIIANIKIKRDFLNGNCENIDSVIKDFPPIKLVELLLSQRVVEEQRLKIATELVARCKSQDTGIRTEIQECIITVNRDISENPPLIALIQKNIPGHTKISRVLFNALNYEFKKKVRDAVNGFKTGHILSPTLKAFDTYINQSDNHSIKSKKYLLDGNYENIDLVIAKFCPRDLVELLLSKKVVEEQRIKIATELVARCNSQEIKIRTETQECITEVNKDISKSPPLITLLQNSIPKGPKISKMLFNALDYGSKAKVRNDVENFKTDHTFWYKYQAFENYINQSDDRLREIKKDFLDGNCENIDSIIANTKVKRDFLNGNCENIDSVIKDFPTINLVELLLSKKVVGEQRIKIAEELVARCRDEESDIRTETQEWITTVNSKISTSPPLIALLQNGIPQGSEISKMLFDALDGKSKEKVRDAVKDFKITHPLSKKITPLEKYINKPDHPTKSDETNSIEDIESESWDINNDELLLFNDLTEQEYDDLIEKLYHQSIVENLHSLLTAEQKPKKTLLFNLLKENSKNIDSVIEISPTVNLIKLLLSEEVVEEQRKKIATELVARCNHTNSNIKTETQECITTVNSRISKNSPLIALFQPYARGNNDISNMLFDALDEASKEKVRDAVKGFKITYPLSKKITPLEKYINQSDNHTTNSDEANSIEDIESESWDINNDELLWCNYMPKRQRDESTEVSSYQQIVDKLYSVLTAKERPLQNLLLNLLKENLKNIDSVIEISPTINLIKLLLSEEVVEEQCLKIATELVARCNHTESNIKTETQECITTVNSNISKNSPLITLLQNSIPKGPKISKTLFDALDGKYKEKVRDAVKDFKTDHNSLKTTLKAFDTYINQSDNHTTNSDEANIIDENEFPYYEELGEMFPNIQGLDLNDQCCALGEEFEEMFTIIYQI